MPPDALGPVATCDGSQHPPVRRTHAERACGFLCRMLLTARWRGRFRAGETRCTRGNRPAAERGGEKPGGDTKRPGRTPDMVREKVAVASGEKGRGYGEGLITTPLKALWIAKEKLVSDQIIMHWTLTRPAKDTCRRLMRSSWTKSSTPTHLQLPTLPAGSATFMIRARGRLGS